MIRRLALVACVVVVFPAWNAAQEPLTDQSIAAAVQVGTKDKGKEHGLILRDSAQSFAAALGGRNNTASSGFSVELYTPTAWIRRLAAQSAKQYKTLTPNEIGDDNKEAVLRIVANPDVPSVVTAEGMRGTSSVDHVVLQDKARKVTMQPASKESFNVESANAMGGRAQFTGLTAKFALAEMKEIRGPKGDQEFFVVIIGNSGEEKRFEVKRGHFERLP